MYACVQAGVLSTQISPSDSRQHAHRKLNVPQLRHSSGRNGKNDKMVKNHEKLQKMDKKKNGKNEKKKKKKSEK